MIYQPTTIKDIQDVVIQSERLLVRGAGTKTALSTPAEEHVDILGLKGCCGIIEYQPEEYTFTAFAGSSILEINQELSRSGQFLPFDPPLVKQGATLGGTVAAGINGPGRYRSGGVRDFILGVRFVDGSGQIVRGGGKVVKNAAGFDLPKLMVGSLGKMGIMVELTFKVFPAPPAYATIQQRYPDVGSALEAMHRAARARVDLEALDLFPDEKGFQVWARLAGLAVTLPPRLNRLEEALGGGQILPPEDEAEFWESGREFSWAPRAWSLIKHPLTPAKIPSLEHALEGKHLMRRYSAGGQVAWISMEESPRMLEPYLLETGLNALTIWGPPGMARLGEFKGQAFHARLRSVFDPRDHFVEA